MFYFIRKKYFRSHSVFIMQVIIVLISRSLYATFNLGHTVNSIHKNVEF